MDGGYERINEIFPMRVAESNMIHTLHNISVGSQPGDIIDGLVV
jgi:hypothetical protein